MGSVWVPGGPQKGKMAEKVGSLATPPPPKSMPKSYQIRHPKTNIDMVFEAPIPDDLQRALEILKNGK